jgi:hypothetical protein
MQTSVHPRHKPPRDLSASLQDAALLLMLFTIAAIGIACGVLLLIA